MVDGGEEGDDVGEGVDGLIADGGLGEVEMEAEERVEECHVVCAKEGGEEGELLGREEVELVLVTKRPQLLRLVVAVVRDVRHDRELITLVHGHVLRINDRRNVHLFLGNVLGVLNPLVATRLAVGLVHADEVRFEPDQLEQRVAVVPVRAEVLDRVFNIIRVDPFQQRGLRRVRLVP